MDTATTEIYTLSLHERSSDLGQLMSVITGTLTPVLTAMLFVEMWRFVGVRGDRKSTRLNSSHTVISYAVFCLKKKKQRHNSYRPQEYRCWFRWVRYRYKTEHT